ncbi:molybdopterin-dependent oxidoreductase [Nocardioides sp. WS12]|uniref:molybdopterin-dependent oxidoreductase n=1 Tax=Nocardioides sp. WS12 TaxID=2486272 RepID=UPI0015FE08E4|nr:molybdopterin-dependent oxidoreductase [Nocardioides sp. WS12]
MTVEQKVTYCRICEPLCGLVATVEDGRLLSLRPDQDHPLSRGQACPKGIAFTDVQNDPDRVLHPLRRNASGEFEQVSWDDALSDIATRLKKVRSTYGGKAVGMYFGNPSAFSYSTTLWVAGFMKGLGSDHLYSAGSQDINSRFVASQLLYGALTQLPFPDLPRTDFLLVLGANPLVSHGSAINAPRIKDHLKAITTRGGRVVVVDPRRSETARAFEHISVKPDSDAWLLLSLLHVVFEEGLADEAALRKQARGVDLLRTAAAAQSPEDTEAITGVPAATVRQLARDFATAPSATAYGRTGACLGRHATLVSFLIDALSIVTGNLDRAGGTLFSVGAIPLEEMAERVGLASYDKKRSRLGDFPEVLGSFPAALMADEITTPGKGQMKAMFLVAGNPVLSVPNGEALSAALPELDLLVSLDLYVNDTNRHADYVLPATTFLEREDFPIAIASAAPTPFFQSTEAVLAPYGEARQEWEIVDEIARRAGVALFMLGPLRHVGKPVALAHRLSPVWLSPRALMENLLRLGPYGDRFGLRRGGLNAAKLRKNPHGIVLGDHAATGQLKHAVRHRGGKVRLDPPAIAEELARLGDRHVDDPAFPLRLIGLRELRSQNSWMHNSELLMKGKREHRARINPSDAVASGIADGGQVRIRSEHGVIETIALLTDEVREGTVAVPHGWGHVGGGWERANKAGGANVNQLTSSNVTDVERLAGMSHLNGVPIALEAV